MNTEVARRGTEKGERRTLWGERFGRLGWIGLLRDSSTSLRMTDLWGWEERQRQRRAVLRNDLWGGAGYTFGEFKPMKRAFFVLVEFVLFFVVFLAGSLWDPFKMKWFVSHPTLTSTRFFVPDGLILMAVVFVLILGIEAARKRLASGGMVATIAFAMALLLGFLSKFGWATHDIF
jgi:hypothetical protein